MSRYKVQLRGGFADRMGIAPINTTMQTTDLDKRTRTILANYFREVFQSLERVSEFESVLYGVLLEVYVVPVSRNHLGTAIPAMLATIEEDSYADVFSLLEYIVPRIMRLTSRFNIRQVVNSIFEQEYVGYRLIDNKIAPITSTDEIESIESALHNPYSEVSAHISKSVALLSDRNSPDYENSIKESISAVERMCSIIIGKSTTLNDALKKLTDQGLTIHPALKSAFDKLYAYTSDSSGIRHAGQLGGSDATFEEAQFMLVSCSAFINYLRGAMSKQGIKR